MNIAQITSFFMEYDFQIVFGVISLFILTYLIYLSHRLNAFFKGADGRTLEKDIKRIKKENETLKYENSEIKKLIIKLMESEKLNIKSVATVKFNPFSQSGHGKQSFATAMLNSLGDGFVLSTLSVRGETHVFLKDVVKFASDQSLTDEESKALEKAKKKLYN